MDPFIDCFEINCIYEAEWNQTDRSKSDRKAWENLRVLWRASPLPPRAGKPFKAVAAQRPAFGETSLMMSKPDLCSLQTSTSYFGKICFFNTSTHSLFCSREHQRASCPSFLNHSDKYMKTWEGVLVNVDSLKKSHLFPLTVSHKTWFPNTPFLHSGLLLDNTVLMCHCPFYIWGTRSKKYI